MSKTPNKKRLPKWIIVVASIVLGLAVFCIGIFAYYSSAFAGKIFPNVFAADINLGGLTAAEAEEKLQARIDQFAAGSLELSIDGKQDEIFIADLNPDINIEKAITEAYGVGRSESAIMNAFTRVTTVFYKNNISSFASVESDALKTELERLDKEYSNPEKDAGIKLVDGKISITPDQDGVRINREGIEVAISNSFKNLSLNALGDFPLQTSKAKIGENQINELKSQIEQVLSETVVLTHKTKKFTLSKEKIATWLTFEPTNSTQAASTKIGVNRDLTEEYAKTISEQITIEPVNAKLKMENGKAIIFESSKDGIELDIDKTVTLIIDEILSRTVTNNTNTNGINGNYGSSTASSNIIELPTTAKKAQVTDNTLENLGIKELIGKGETDFAGSPNNRVHNITLGTNHLNGLLVAPGEEFSTVGALGEIEASTGYLPELVIKNNITVPEYGGGLCQVSTTLFRAALDSGLKITARREHSFRVGYYEREVGPGLDATIYVPNPDFKFLNDTPGWILVQGQIKGKKVSFEIYGTNDGRESKIDGPHILSTTPAPAPTYTKTNNLAPGEVRQIASAVGGAKTTAKYSVYRDGKLLFEQTFNSTYKAVPARYLVGPDKPKEEPKKEVKGTKDEKKKETPKTTTPTETPPSEETGD